MTRINKLIIKGFKSFGNRTELIFDSNFACVLGPNGAGKSNILDALCFVLGKGSAKGLRAEKSANLIYNGGKLKNPAKQGEVSIYFDNTKKTFPSESPEIKVTRIIRQDGQSVYKINDERRTKQQILDLLAIASIDPDGYNIILQGDIIRLVEMQPIERRKIIEEIAGISIYEEKKDRAIRELEKVEEKINEAEIILTERQTYLKELKKERDQALKYKDLNDKKNRNQVTILSIQIEEKNSGLSKLATEIAENKEKIAKVQAEIDSYKKAVEEKKDEIKRLNAEIEQKGEKDQVKLLKEVEQLKVDVATNSTRVSSCENEITRINNRKDQLQKSMSELESKITELNSEKNRLEKEKSRAGKEIEMLEVKISSFKKKHKMEDAENIDKEIEEMDKSGDELQKEIQGFRETQQNLLREKDRIEYQINTIDEKMGRLLELEKQNKNELAQLKQKKEEFKKTTLELSKLLNDDASLAAQLGNARKKSLSAQEELAKLNAHRSTIRESTAGNTAVKKILENKSKFGTIYGLVSELGTVQSKYSTALEVAAGPRLKSIVVDTDKTGADCIKYLKENRLGTATFLPVNKIKATLEGNLKDILSINGVHGMASELITYEPKFKNIFSYVFANTVIVENIDVARRVGIGTVKMATLDGDLMELSGAMHGGFREKKGSGFLEKEVMGRIKELERQSEEQEHLVSVLEKKRAENEEAISRFREFKANLEGEIIKQEKSLHLESADLDTDKKAKTTLKDAFTDISKRIDESEKKIGALNKELTTIKIRKQDLRSRINELRSPTLIAELNSFEQKKTELKEALININSNSKNIEMQVTNILAPEKENIVKILKQHDKEEESFKVEIANLKDKIKAQRAELSEKEEAQKKFYGKFKELYTQRDKINNIINKEEAKIIGLEEQARRIEQKINMLAIDEARIKAELSGLQEENSRYKYSAIFKDKSIEECKKEIWQFEKLVSEIGSVNMKALEVYDAIEQEYNKLLDKRDTLRKEKDEVLLMINEIETKKTGLFMKTFDVVNDHFKKMFAAISSKGEAFLELENPKLPLEDGMLIKVRITGKKFLDIRSLSGGEKTLTALAFIFAIQEHEPASFYVLDEVDAALDKRNSEKLAKLFSKYTNKAQYVIISHNDGIIGEATTLYGVSMDKDNNSKVVSLKI